MNEPITTRRRVAAVAMMAAVVTRVASIFLWPPNSDASDAKMLAAAGTHPLAWQLATAAEAVTWLLAGFAVLTSIRLVPRRGFWLTQLGGWVYGASLLALGFVGGAVNSVTGVLGSEPDRALMTRVQGDLGSPVLGAMIALIVLGEPLMVVFALGMARCRLVGWWYPALSAVALAAFLATSDSSDHLVVLGGFLPLAASWVVLARLLRDGSAQPSALEAPSLTGAPA